MINHDTFHLVILAQVTQFHSTHYSLLCPIHLSCRHGVESVNYDSERASMMNRVNTSRVPDY